MSLRQLLTHAFHPDFQPGRVLPVRFCKRVAVNHRLQHFGGVDSRQTTDHGVGFVILVNEGLQRIVRYAGRIWINVQAGSLKRDLCLIVRQLPVVLEVLLLFALANFIERRLSNINMSALDQVTHLTEEKSEQQRTDMRTVYIGIRHDDDAVIPKVFRREFLIANATPQRLD